MSSVTAPRVTAASSAGPRPLRVVHLPVYRENAYQPMLMEAQAAQGLHVIDGGGGGNFLRTALRTWRPDILHVHWLHPYLLRPSMLGSWARGGRFLLELALLRRSGVAIVWTVHNLANHNRHQPGIELALTRRFVRLCDAIITHGRAASASARQHFRIPASVPVEAIPFPHYSAQYPNDTTRSTARSHLGMNETGFVITFLGRIEPYKQVAELISAFREVAPEDARLLIAGKASDDSYADELRRRAVGDARIRLDLRFIADDEMQYYMNAADVVACPSKGILTSSSVLLAFSFARPVVAPAEGCIPETVGSAGYLYDSSDARARYRTNQSVLGTLGVAQNGNASGRTSRRRAPG